MDSGLAAALRFAAPRNDSDDERSNRSNLPKEKPSFPLRADVRRGVTTNKKKKKGVVLLDGPNPHKKAPPTTNKVRRMLGVTDRAPADLCGTGDRAAIDIGIMPPLS